MTAQRGMDASGEPQAAGWKPGFNEFLLGGVILLTVVIVAAGLAFYLLPGDYLQIPELQPAIRVARAADFPPGASRVATWGSRVLLVVHDPEGEYAALQGTSPLDGCILQWDATALRVVSPCTSLVYDLHGNVVRGLTTVPLQRYTAFVRQNAVYVTEP